MSDIILPGATLGVLGSGQLGRMFAIAARRMGYRVHTYSPGGGTPTGQVSDKEVRGSYDDLDAVRAFASDVAVVTFEFENVPAATAEAAAQCAPVRPAGAVLHTTQNRLREKRALQAAGVPVSPFAEVHSSDDVRHAAVAIGLPAVLKTAGWGYDGKGQARVADDGAIDDAWASIATDDAIMEAFVDFEAEVSVVAARGADGDVALYDVIHNDHQNHILDISVAPAPIDAAVAKEAQRIARAIMEELDVVGVLCVEFFLPKDGGLLVNELAPRPHNSGHLTFDAAITSQFEQQVRAICGLPLGSTELVRPAAMANLLGDLWEHGEPDWAAAAFPNVKIHLYGKAEARPGRKMGHLTALADDAATATRDVRGARDALAAKPARV